MSAATIELSQKAQTIIDSLDGLTVLELAQLVKALEEKYGVSASAPVAMMAAGAATGAPAEVVEKTEFEVVLKSAGDKKIQVIKVVREITGLGLKEAKDLVDGAPKTIKDGVNKEEAASIKAKVEEQGATVEVK